MSMLCLCSVPPLCLYYCVSSSSSSSVYAISIYVSLVPRGLLWDLEYLLDDSNRRIAAFGRSAGLVGMALGLLAWAKSQTGNTMTGPLHSWPSINAMILDVSAALSAISTKPRVLVLGALGRCGSGAVWVCEQVGVIPIKWDIAETQSGGPFPALADSCHILVNSIYLSADNPIAAFLTQEVLDESQRQGKRQLSVLVDVSCDTSNPHHPFPFYRQNTTLTQPILLVPVNAGNSDTNSHPNPPLQVIAIDHLPALIPNEASRDFSQALTPHLQALATLHSNKEKHPSAYIWHKAEQIFQQKVATLPQ